MNLIWYGMIQLIWKAIPKIMYVLLLPTQKEEPAMIGVKNKDLNATMLKIM